VVVSRWCLDTSAYSNFRRNDPAIVDLFDAATALLVPTIVLGELRSGFALGRKQQENERELAAFLRHPVIEMLDVDDASSRIYAEIVVALRAAGTPLPTNDIWIAAVAVREGATVLTYDEHFRAIHRVGTRVLEASLE
jgi:predicted nucleic acid-binding protein